MSKLIKKILDKLKSVDRISLKTIKKCYDDIPNISNNSIIEYSKLKEYIEYIKDFITFEENNLYRDQNVSISHINDDFDIKNLIECKEKLYLENFTNNKITIKIYNIDVNNNVWYRGTGTWIDKFMFFVFIQNEKVKMLIELRYIHQKIDYRYSCNNIYYIVPKIHIIN